MKKGPAVNNGTVSPGCTDCSPMSGKASKDDRTSHRVQNRDRKERQGSGQVRMDSQESRQRPLLTVTTLNATTRSHQRRWSADLCKCETSPVIIVRKNKKEPQPPQRGVSLLRPHTASHSSIKRYSCPPSGLFASPSQSSSSSPSSSTTSSCSSPPPVKTSDITGHDPLGWKLRPKPVSAAPRACTNRLSLQVPLPVVFPDPNSGPTSNSLSDSTSNPDPSPKPKPSRRRYSDSSAFPRSLVTRMPAVTLEELCAVHLCSVTHSHEPDDVFTVRNEEEVKVTTRPRKIPPPVPDKTATARQIAQLIARSLSHYRPVTTKESNMYSNVMKPKHSPHTVHHDSLGATKTGLRLDASCDREKSTPHLPGREI
uniref:putative protein TPRXL isoform X2 n=1 Tax=Monopterus albus TaxID=43700 RepID=UPI0009B32A92|nr:putative protein TPRXL isoform X2 [Monopterus albus]